MTQYKNAFAHDTLAHNGEAQELQFFEGQPCRAVLNDSYFDELESTFLEAWTLLEYIQAETARHH